MIVILAAINPYESSRSELSGKYNNVKTAWIKCAHETLIKRDTKGLYKKALLGNNDKDKLLNLSGVNDVYEEPLNADLIIETDLESVNRSAFKLLNLYLILLPRNNN